MKPLKLFCLPYAGGSSSIYTRWQTYIDPHVKVFPIELKGRGRRIHEPLYSTLADVVEDVINLIQPEILNSDYALFGHSMGAIIAYEVAQSLLLRNLRAPIHIFFSGRSAPHIERPDEQKYHLMTDLEFEKEVLRLGGTPKEIFENKELREFFLPLLRKDFQISETAPRMEIAPMATPMTVFFGRDEDLTVQQREEWSLHTTGSLESYNFSGGHFFIHNHQMEIGAIISKTLADNGQI